MYTRQEGIRDFVNAFHRCSSSKTVNLHHPEYERKDLNAQNIEINSVNVAKI